MIRLEQAVIVEGKYDKIKLSGVVDALILQTNGFRIFKDKEKRALIKSLAHGPGIVILTDSDTAGLVIRNFVKSVAGGGKVTNVYIPQILGKEKRKQQPSKEGTLGVEGMTEQVLLQALERAGIGSCTPKAGRQVTKLDFFEDGLTGKSESARLRSRLLSRLELPGYLSSNALLEVVNAMMDYEEYKQLVKQLEEK